MLVLMRFIIGVAIGVASEAVPVYIAEMVCAEKRGSMGTVFQLMITSARRNHPPPEHPLTLGLAVAQSASCSRPRPTTSSPPPRTGG